MKKQLLLIILILITIEKGWTQEGITICHTPATERFAMLATDDDFVSLHIKPEKYTYRSETGEMITFPVADGKDGRAFMIKAKKASDNYLIVIHEWWGLNDQIKREAERLYNDLGNVNVLAVDLYDGKLTDKQQEAAQYMQSIKTERAEAILNGAFAYAGKKAKIASIGWCFGGGWSLQAAILAGKRAHAAVVYYGMPEKDVERLKMLSTDVLGIFAGREQWINKTVVEEFAENMEKAGKKLEYKIFDAEHAFANPSNPNYDKQATEEAYAMSLAYLKERLK